MERQRPNAGHLVEGVMKNTKVPYSARFRCRIHEDEIAAVCPLCHDAAVNQQERQAAREREVAHREWLKKGRIA